MGKRLTEKVGGVYRGAIRICFPPYGDAFQAYADRAIPPTSRTRKKAPDRILSKRFAVAGIYMAARDFASDAKGSRPKRRRLCAHRINSKSDPALELADTTWPPPPPRNIGGKSSIRLYICSYTSAARHMPYFAPRETAMYGVTSLAKSVSHRTLSERLTKSPTDFFAVLPHCRH